MPKKRRTVTSRMTEEERNRFLLFAESLGETPSRIVRTLVRDLVNEQGKPGAHPKVVCLTERLKANAARFIADGIIDDVERATLTRDATELLNDLWHPDGEAA